MTADRTAGSSAVCKEVLGNKPHELCSYSPEPRTEVYCFRLNCNISKLVYYVMSFSLVCFGRTLCVLCGASILVRFCIIQYCAGLLIISMRKPDSRFSTLFKMFALQCNWNIVTEKKKIII